MPKIYNTLTRDKQEFMPLEPGKVKMYVCGMTVYDDCHVGHARAGVAFDMVQRWLRASGYAVTFVRNITDIDDKIIKRAIANGETIGQLTTRYIARMHEDFAVLGILPPDIEPRATNYIPQMLGLIGKLEQNGLAYRTNDGDVNFSVRKFPGYGKLSGKSLEQLRAGERVAVEAGKQDPLDFVLWKHAKADEPAEAKWESPWGVGRPGWHIECSAMACQELGASFDIHGGGADLQFPHHENEIAQSEGANGQMFAHVWMHNGFVNVDNEKMSKSLGNFFTIRDVLKVLEERYGSRDKAGEVLRFFLLRTHYRSPINYADTLIDDAKSALTRLYTALRSVAPVVAPAMEASIDWNEAHALRFKEALDDDFNTPLALAALFDLANEVNKTGSAALAAQLRELAGVLGFLERDPQEFLQSGANHSGPEQASIEAGIQAAIVQRSNAKKSKDFAEADRIRTTLLNQGIILEDSASGTTWRRA
jgi:cysteinyl-tRNA synthetase